MMFAIGRVPSPSLNKPGSYRIEFDYLPSFCYIRNNRLAGISVITEKKVNGTVIKLVQGDITQCRVETLVNAANNHLWMGGGVAGAIKRAGGKVIEEEAMKQGPVPVGSAVLTTAGKLPCRYVIHAAVMGQDLKTDGEKIRQATLAALEICRKEGIGSVAFPALGTGVGDFPLSQAAKIMLKAVTDSLRDYAGLKLVLFALFDKAAFEAFRKELENIEALT